MRISSQRRLPRGFIVGWVLVVVGAVGAMLGAIELTVTARSQSAAVVAALPSGILTALLGLYMQAQRDLFEVVMFSTVASFAVALITGAVFLAGERPHPLAGATAVLLLTIMVACVVHLIRAQRVDPRYPDILAVRFGKGAARELEGVQFILQASASRVRPGETFFLEFTVQNTWDAQRTLSFTRFGKPDGSSMPPDLSVTIGPGEVQLLRIPVTVGRAMRGQAILQLDARVAGDGGRRVRNRRVAAFVPRVTGGQQLLAFLGGHLVSGGGLKFQMPVDGPPLTGEPALEAPVEARLIWKPGMGG
jgi:hypothetical protein